MSRWIDRVRGSCAAALTAWIAPVWLLATPAVSAEAYPSRPVKIVVPFPAGGPLDTTARLIAEKLAASLKQPFVVENRPGASGNVGTDAVAKATPDGYTLLFVLDTPLTVHPWLYAKLPFDPARDLTPVAMAASFSLTLVVHPSVPVNSATEFVAHARSLKEKPLMFGSGGARGDPGHLTMEYFRRRAEFDGVHVPYRGNPEVVASLVGGHIQAGFLATPGVLQNVRDGRLKALAVSSPQRVALAPEIPTIAESGFAGFEAGFYQLMLVPAGTPEPIRATLEREVQRALQDPELQGRLRALAMEPVGAGGAATVSLLKAASERWQAVIKAANIRIE